MGAFGVLHSRGPVGHIRSGHFTHRGGRRFRGITYLKKRTISSHNEYDKETTFKVAHVSKADSADRKQDVY